MASSDPTVLSEQSPASNCLFVVGIGASAGGLQAIEAFFDTIPVDSGAAFVVVQHLSPDYKSLMNELLERRTQMDVRRVTDGIALETNTVFLISPGQNLVVKGNQLRLIPQDRAQGYQPHFPIDLFFQSLATEHGDRTIGIILSGTGSDGTRGLREISEAGGLVLVQDPKTAEFDGMPQSAIATGMVDLSLSPGELAQATYEFVTTPSGWEQWRNDRHDPVDVPQIQAPTSIRSLKTTQTRFDPLLEVAFQNLLTHQDATCLLVDRQNQLLHVCGDSLKLLQGPSGRASQNSLKMLPEGLQLPISTALYQAQQNREQVEYRGCQIVDINGDHSTVTIAASLHSANRATDDFLMVLIKREEPHRRPSTSPTQLEANTETAQYVSQLEYKLQKTRENLQATIEQLETTNAEQQSTNNELKTTNARLKTEVRERQKIEQELAQRASDLTQSNAGLQQFAYVISHDLQEPLRAMTVFSQLLQQRYKKQLDDTATGYIKNIVQGGIRMKAMIDGILAFSRISKKETSKTIVPVNLQKPLELALENLKVVCQQQHVAITQDPLPTLAVEQNHMVQLFQNLIGNAIKFCNNAPKIHIIAQSQSDGYVFGIRDNGLGISKPDQERIFQLFQRLHTRQEHDGYGIGLAVCQQIVQRYGGRLWVESEPNQGSTFYFTLLPQGQMEDNGLPIENTAAVDDGDEIAD